MPLTIVPLTPAVGAQVAGSSTRELTVASIQRRADPTGPDGAAYAVLHCELRERVAMVGGTLTVESSPGGPTTVFVRIPAFEGTGAAGDG